jgi:DNA-binding NtrC family response regulator
MAKEPLMKSNILIIDDEDSILVALKYALSSYNVKVYQKATEALESIINGSKFDIILCDLMMPDMPGNVFLTEIKKYLKSYKTILITAYTTEDLLEQGLNEELFNRLIRKPVNFPDLIKTVQELIVILAQERSKDYNNIIAKLSNLNNKGDRVIYNSSVMDEIVNMAQKYAKYDENVCIEGESGVGKEVFASFIHNNSKRAGGPFIKVNCSAIPENLFESEFFGYKKGSFTGASADKQGKFKIANKGTLFLDEIGDMPLDQQAKLLRVLEEHEVTPIGSNNPEKIDVRVICATNRKMDEEANNGTFRSDLRHRLNVLSLHIPPLRERKEDIPLLAIYYLTEYINSNGEVTKAFNDEALDYLTKLELKGNVRELKNLVIKLYVLSNECVINKDEVINLVKKPILPSNNSLCEYLSTLSISLEQLQIEYLMAQLKKHDYHVSNTAKAIGCVQSHLSRKISEIGLSIKELKNKKEK